MYRALILALPLTLCAHLPFPASRRCRWNPPGKADMTRVTAGAYTADPSHSLIGWRVNHLGFNDYFGLFGDVSGGSCSIRPTWPPPKLTGDDPCGKGPYR